MAQIRQERVYNLTLSELEAEYLEYFMHYALVDDDDQNEPLENSDVHERIYNALKSRPTDDPTASSRF